MGFYKKGQRIDVSLRILTFSLIYDTMNLN